MRESVDNKVGAPSPEAIDEMAMKLAMFKTGDEMCIRDSTYTAQLEAFKDYRSGAEPEVTVVSVTDRGQTTVDRVSQPTTRSKAAPDRLSLKAA